MSDVSVSSGETTTVVTSPLSTSSISTSAISTGPPPGLPSSISTGSSLYMAMGGLNLAPQSGMTHLTQALGGSRPFAGSPAAMGAYGGQGGYTFPPQFNQVWSPGVDEVNQAVDRLNIAGNPSSTEDVNALFRSLVVNQGTHQAYIAQLQCQEQQGMANHLAFKRRFKEEARAQEA